MNSLNKAVAYVGKSLAVATMITLSSTAASSSLSPLVDSFDHKSENSLGIARMMVSDVTAGGKTRADATFTKGVMQLKGEILPPRGQPGWASSVLLLDAKGQPQDASAYQGIKMRVKVNQGQLSVSANSSEVTNFDYHAAPVIVAADGKFHEIKIPFTSMKRAWSEQTELNTKTIASLSIVAFSMQPAPFNYEVDEIAFY